MAMGIVSLPTRVRKLVAPNSPREMAKAKPAPATSARRRKGRSISRHTRDGEAPSVDAASRRRGSMARSVGRTARTTKGTATTAWAMGMRTHEPLRSSGRWSMVMSRPKPTVTADVPSGSMSPASRSEPTRREAAMATAALPPTTTATTVASTAKRSEVPTAASGSATGRLAGPRPGAAPRPRHADKPRPSPPRSEPATRRPRGRTTIATSPATVVATRARCRAVRGAVAVPRGRRRSVTA